MKYKSILTTAMLGALTLTTPGCQDEFAQENTNPSAVTKADVRYLFTQALYDFEPSKYQQWFYNNLAYSMPWVQATVSETGNMSSMNMMGAYESSQSQVINVKLYTEEILYTLSLMDETEKASYENIRVMCNPLLVYLGLFGSDMYGSIPYTEGGKGLHELLLTPKYETQESLFETWIAQLDETIDVLGQNLSGQVPLGKQDFVYNGDTKKWAKFANSLKLRIAVRMLHVNKARALEIAQQVENSPAGVMSSLEDGFFYCRGAQEYHWGDDVLDGQGKGIGSEQLVSFLVNHEDPRVRFIFQKNDFNSRVVKAFLKQGVALPPYIKANVVLDANGNFEEWGGKGEPWVRYYGAPSSTEARNNAATNDAYFNADKFKLENKDGNKKQYVPLARVNREMLQGQKDYTFPDAPDTQATIDNQDNAWYGLHYGASEVQLYLAELKLLGANLSKSAEEYLKEGIKLSVMEYDRLAELNKIPYYSSKYDELEETLELKDGEIDNLLSSADYTKLDGTLTENLEKVYIQQYINFMLQPNEQFVQVRRSGVPMRNSQLLPWVDFTTNDANFSIPRRWTINTPLESDLMYSIKVEAYKAQGFTTGTTDPGILNRERVWYDQGAPNFGEGPNF